MKRWETETQGKNLAWMLPRPKPDRYPGGLLIVYHKYIMPNPNPKVFSVIKRVFIGNRTYPVPRAAIYFIKESEN